jgi:predicted oxidoreductase (fatty acid repression mutant protein)
MEKNMSDILASLHTRHSQYVLTGTSALSDRKLVDLVSDLVVAVPSAFNSQSQRAVLLFGADHAKLWDIVKDALRAVSVDEEAFKKTEEKIDSFAAAHATVLFFDDEETTSGFAEKFATYAGNFPIWAQQSAGMLQLSVWTALSEQGLGASLQHYNPLIDEEVHRVFGIPASWKLLAQMPFGDIVTPTGNTERMDASERVVVKGL